MIFVTVGTQVAFDRLVDVVDAWAAERGTDEVFAQIGPADHEPRHIAWARSLTPSEFTDKLMRASVVIAHAGMGTILQALDLGKPLLIMPRRAELGEQRNDHQLATAQRFAELCAVTVAWDRGELREKLDSLDSLAVGEQIRPHASESLLERLRGFLGESFSKS